MGDRFVTDNIRHEIKHPFQNYGADLNDLMDNKSVSSTGSKKKSARKSEGGKQFSED